MKQRSKYSSNYLAKAAVFLAQSLFLEIVRSCPLPPIEYKRTNITLSKVFISMVPSGIYRLRVQWKHGNEDVMFNLSVLGEIF